MELQGCQLHSGTGCSKVAPMQTFDASPDYAERAREVLNALKKWRGYSDSAIGERAGLSRFEVLKRRTGDRALKVADVGRLAEAFDVDPAVFFQDPDEVISRLTEREQKVRPIRSGTRRDMDVPSTMWSGNPMVVKAA